jgi:peptide deformylase
MILPIVAYGAQVLRKKADAINKDYPELSSLLENMWLTMYNSNGVGLAAPQINKSIRLFLVDSIQMFENMEEDDNPTQYADFPGIKQVFINAQILDVSGDTWAYNEGCLSIPKIREDVMRPLNVTLQYQDENFATHTQTFTGLTARVILHEYDHIEGKLFIDYLTPLKKRLIKGKLEDISKGKVRVDYKMITIK